MELSVVICTHNRGNLITATLESIRSQLFSKIIRWEVLIVDNNSNDLTKEAIIQFVKSNPDKFRYVHEPEIGLSHARNTGIRKSIGNYISFFDDDTILQPGCLCAIYETFVKYNADCVGGKIIPLWPQKQPVWFIKQLYGDLAYLDMGDNELFIRDHTKTFYGANISFSKKVFTKHGFFDTRLGRIGHKLYISEESDMFSRIVKFGGIAVYQPKAVVLHIVGERRVRRDYFRKLHFHAGEHHALLDGRYSGKHILGIPLFMFYNFFKGFLKFIKSFLSMKKDYFFRELILWNFAGYFKGKINIFMTNQKSLDIKK